MKSQLIALTITAFMAASAVAREQPPPSKEGAVAPNNLPATTGGQQYGGTVLCTAAVNSDGTRAGGMSLVSTKHILTGEYEVIFYKACTNITAANGWARWVQVDGLSTAVPFGITCSTADRNGNSNGIFVDCVDSNGQEADTSFFLFVAR